MNKNEEAGSNMSYKCPACGKQVFNRRYPRCEFCGESLPSDMVYSAEERQALFESDRKASENAWRERQIKEEENERAERGRGG